MTHPGPGIEIQRVERVGVDERTALVRVIGHGAAPHEPALTVHTGPGSQHFDAVPGLPSRADTWVVAFGVPVSLLDAADVVLVLEHAGGARLALPEAVARTPVTVGNPSAGTPAAAVARDPDEAARHATALAAQQRELERALAAQREAARAAAARAQALEDIVSETDRRARVAEAQLAGFRAAARERTARRERERLAAQQRVAAAVEATREQERREAQNQVAAAEAATADLRERLALVEAQAQAAREAGERLREAARVTARADVPARLHAPSAADVATDERLTPTPTPETAPVREDKTSALLVAPFGGYGWGEARPAEPHALQRLMAIAREALARARRAPERPA